MSISSKKAAEEVKYPLSNDNQIQEHLTGVQPSYSALSTESGRSSAPNAGGAEMVIVTTKAIYAADYHECWEATKTQSSLNYPIPQG